MPDLTQIKPGTGVPVDQLGAGGTGVGTPPRRNPGRFFHAFDRYDKETKMSGISIAESRKVLLAQVVLDALAQANSTCKEGYDALRLAIDFIPQDYTSAENRISREPQQSAKNPPSQDAEENSHA